VIAIAKSHVGFRAKQKAVRPVVYFDNWAWRLFSEDKLLKKRFVSTLVEKRGTLVVSWFGLAEFSIYSDSKHGEAADDLIEAVFPHLVFFNSDFFQVAAAERQLPCSGTIAMQCYDQDVFKAYAEGCLRGRPPRLHRIFQTPAFRQQLDDVLTNIAARIEAFRIEPKDDRQFLKLVERFRANPGRQHPIAFVFSELIRNLLVDTKVPITHNDAADFCHAIVPVSHCQFVLLDGRWKTLVNQARKRLLSSGIDPAFASVYSRRDVEQFLHELERFDPSHPRS